MSLSILVVDDETDVAALFRQHFRHEVRQGQYVLHFACSGEEALRKLENGVELQLLVILSDINMPGMDGLALLREIKHLRPGVPSSLDRGCPQPKWPHSIVASLDVTRRVACRRTSRLAVTQSGRRRLAARSAAYGPTTSIVASGRMPSARRDRTSGRRRNLPGPGRMRLRHPVPPGGHSCHDVPVDGPRP